MSKKYNFFALAARMKFINRWGLMRNTHTENVQQHSLDVAVIAHGLAVIHNRIFGGSVSPDRVAAVAMYHDVSEIITGDMPTPVKYYNPDIIAAYKDIENTAKDELLAKLPDELRGAYQELFYPDDAIVKQLVKAADKLSAYIKCVEEENAGNREFIKAKKSLAKSIEKMNLKEATYFMEKFVPAYALTLDEI